ncbi:MAG: dTMP kinase [Myxococcales bacterium]|nr:dTMP kinase [Myxococcales bacterium]
MNDPPSRRRGTFVVIEGIDGAGKSTQARLLAEALERGGIQVLLTREPTDGVYGTRIRSAAASGTRLPASEELELFGKDRAEHVDGVILPALEAGSWVVSDRYFLSTAAYQGARGLDPEAILASSEARFPTPDCALLLELAVRDGLGRVEGRGARDAFESEESLAAVARAFASLERPYIERIDASQEPAAVFRAVLVALAARGLVDNDLRPGPFAAD